MKRVTAEDALLVTIRNTAAKVGLNPDHYFILRASDDKAAKSYKRFWVCRADPEASKVFGYWSRTPKEWQTFIEGMLSAYHTVIRPAQGEE